MAVTFNQFMPFAWWTLPWSKAPFLGQSPPFFALAPVNGSGRQLIPDQPPWLTAHM